jgi:hypothetical protein
MLPAGDLDEMELTVLPTGDQDEVEISSTSSWSPAGSIVGALYHKP